MTKPLIHIYPDSLKSWIFESLLTLLPDSNEDQKKRNV